MGDRGKGKEMKGFFAAKQALFPKAAGLVSEAKLLLSGVSYKSYDMALSGKEETLQTSYVEQ